MGSLRVVDPCTGSECTMPVATVVPGLVVHLARAVLWPMSMTGVVLVDQRDFPAFQIMLQGLKD